jgi:hypothetical protein
MQKVIKLNNKKEGTKAFFFRNKGDSGDDSFVFLDINKKPYEIYFNKEDFEFERNYRNNFEKISDDKINSESYNYITGKTETQIYDRVLTEEEKENIIKKYFSASLDELGDDAISWVFFEKAMVDDYYADIILTKTFDTLDTLNVHNSTIGEFPTQQSQTGVVFGRIEAIQKITDEFGNKIRIPLKNTAVSIFTPTEEFPTISSFNEDGNRIGFHLRENSEERMYFNRDNYLFDYNNFLIDTNDIDVIPEKYKYTTMTNEDGEFIIHDVPVGEQTLIVEVNLLKQGLSKDEVALNNFPYPAEESANLDTIPHYVFKQIPITVSPVWGAEDTGYTEVKLTMPIDLRKWTTHFTCPIVYNDKTVQENISEGRTQPIKVEIRDMTRNGFLDNVRLEVVELENVTLREEGFGLVFENEFKQLKSRAEFRTTDYHAFKLPANLYDPHGIGSNGRKGVWLSCYQFKISYILPSVYRATGYNREWPEGKNYYVSRTHFHLNTNNFDNSTPRPEPIIGVFPYEKPWGLNYPERYRIPKTPSRVNSNKKFDSNNWDRAVIFNEPRYRDGDLVGGVVWGADSGGYGIHGFDGSIVESKFSQRVTSGPIFKYENDVRWDEEYSNGHSPIFNKEKSFVVNGEKWQRLESGYGYWLKYDMWPRVENFSWGDVVYSDDCISENNLGLKASKLKVGGSANSTNNSKGMFVLDLQTIAMRFDNKNLRKLGGALDIYRIVDPKQILPDGPPSIKKGIYLNFDKVYIQNRFIDNIPSKLKVGNFDNFFSEITKPTGVITIKNNGETEVVIDGVTIQQGASYSFENKLVSNLMMRLPGNTNFNVDDNSYDFADYEITISGIRIFQTASYFEESDYLYGRTIPTNEARQDKLSPIGNSLSKDLSYTFRFNIECNKWFTSYKLHTLVNNIYVRYARTPAVNSFFISPTNLCNGPWSKQAVISPGLILVTNPSFFSGVLPSATPIEIDCNVNIPFKINNNGLYKPQFPSTNVSKIKVRL